MLAHTFNWKLSLMNCFLIWCIPFILFSPATFGFNRFVVFGFDYRIGVCDWKTDNNMSIQHMSILEQVHLTIILVIALISVLLIIVSYVYLGIFIKKETNKIASLADSTASQVIISLLNISKLHIQLLLQTRSNKIYVILVVLSLSFVMFSGPKTMSIFFNSEDASLDATIHIVCYSFYWWMFAINAFIYVVVSEDFRAIYKLFLCDIYEKLKKLHKC